MTEPLHPVRVRSIRWEAADVYSFELGALDEAPLPPYDPGSHVDVHLPGDLMRSYSLSAMCAGGSYRITVARDAASGGGSAFMAERLRPGDRIEISAPRNNFTLAQDAPRSVFIAGGIGITPFVSMVSRLNELGRAWRLHYCVRTRDRAALRGELEALATAGAGELVMNYDHEPDGRPLDLAGVIGALGPHDHVYCCGPIGMLDAYRAGCAAHGIADERVHFEYFKSDVEAAVEGGYAVVLAKSGRTLDVRPGRTILDTLIEAGLDVPFSCMEGVCGSCEMRVLAGTPDHRDVILSEDERAAGRTMMICCSGSLTPSLTLDA